MTICMYCGRKLPDDAKFCPVCERKLEYPDEGRPMNDPSSDGVNDNVINRSTVGAASVGSIRIGEDRKFCPSCGTPISEKNRGIRCCECQESFCAACETDFRPKRQEGEEPYCKAHYKAHLECIEAERAKKKEQEHVRAEEEKKKSRESELITNSIGMKMKLIPAGEFEMGDEDHPDSPLHKVRITKPFYIGVCPVTQKEWKAVTGKNPSNFKGDDLPVESVSWDDCQNFIAALNKLEGTWKYRLPTEAEWEYACRAGSRTKYCYGNDEGKLGKYAWYHSNSAEKTHPVGTKAPNAWGLHDMHGNVWEWCEDWYDKNYYKNSLEKDPSGPSSGSFRVIRGGGWSSFAGYCSSASRAGGGPGGRGSNLGLRLVRLV